MRPRIAPSILSADSARLGHEVEAVVAAGVDGIDFDGMHDPHVPNPTIGPTVCAAIRPLVSVPIDVHRMGKPLDGILPALARVGADAFAAGSATFGAGDCTGTIGRRRGAIEAVRAVEGRRAEA
jgi:pentose-5-phosphate-3-epimerase